MMARCYDSKQEHYKAYGGAGVRVCVRWKQFRFFLKDMGKRPSGKVLDRKRNAKLYCKRNCRWATYKQSTANRKNTIRLGRERVLDMANRLKIPAQRIYHRLYRGWTKQQIEENPGVIYFGGVKRKGCSSIPFGHLRPNWRLFLNASMATRRRLGAIQT